MVTIKTEYLGELRTRATHVRSGNALITDAPVDNQGKGEAFSPSDLLATALSSCMLTIMGIAASRKGLSIEGTSVETTKTMVSDPRRVGKLEVHVVFPANMEISIQDRQVLERAAKTCPVFYSLHPEIEKLISFTW